MGKAMEPSEVRLLLQALKRHLPSSLHVFSSLLSPLLGMDAIDDPSIPARYDNAYGAVSEIRIIGSLPEEGVEEGAVWGVAIVEIGGQRDDSFNRSHIWLSSESNPSLLNDEAVEAFRSTIRTFILPHMRKVGIKDLMFGSMNQCWGEVLKGMTGELRITADNPCEKSAKRMGLRDTAGLEVPVGYRVRAGGVGDVDTIQSSNKIKFSSQYIERCLRISVSVVRDKSNDPAGEANDGTVDGELASWAVSHDDLAIGALHTAAKYRRKGLAAIVADQITQRTVTAISQSAYNPYDDNEPIWVHGDCESWNTQTIKWFNSLGFEPAVKTTWLSIQLIDA